jgi:DNA helicase-2/ATP-dependent DNA helicase PcrA
MRRLGSNKRAEIVREQLDQIRAVTCGQFIMAATHVRHRRRCCATSNIRKGGWRAMVNAVAKLANSCSPAGQLEDRIARQPRSLRNRSSNAVVLSTIHSAKGVEWDAVFLVGVENSVLPHGNSEDVEEERRVACVGMTRACCQLGLTYSAERYGAKSKPSPFLFEIGGKERRHCIWTGPRSSGANERSSLITASEQQWLAKFGPRALPGAKSIPTLSGQIQRLRKP